MNVALGDSLRNACFLVIGMTVGAGITPDMAAVAVQWPLSIAVLLIGLLAIIGAGAMILHRLFDYDRTTALLAAAPGHLSYVISLSTSIKADVPAISIIQSVRLLILTLAVPLVVVILTGDDVPPLTRGGDTMRLPVLMATASGGILFAFALKRFRVPASFLLGGLLASSIGHLTDFGPGAIPIWLSVPAFIVMGTLIGTRFSGLRLLALRKAVVAAFVVTVFAGLMTVVGALIITFALDISVHQVLVAFAPGGLEAMAAMAILLGVNPAFVSAHHVARILFLTVVIPIVLRDAQKTTNKQKS